jgi:hypothetical protein
VLRLAERDAAIHAASALLHEVLDGGLGENLEIVAGALDGVAVGDGFSGELFKSCGLSHFKLDSDTGECLTQRRKGAKKKR